VTERGVLDFAKYGCMKAVGCPVNGEPHMTIMRSETGGNEQDCLLQRD
jgi:hypothetical protein